MSQDDSKVVGHNEESSGETYGVWGEVDSTSGYGLGTPDDARIDGVVDGGSDWTVEVQDGAFAGNVVQGDPSNSADAGSDGQTVSGGDGNTTNADYTTIAGGNDNAVSGGRGTVAGGSNNVASDTHATVGGGHENEATAAHATVGGGEGNLATEPYATIAGGGRATYQNDSANHVYDRFGTIGGGGNNRAGVSGGTAEYATVSGGMHNDATGESATIGGGWDNLASNDRATVAGGHTNEATSFHATVGGGRNNHATAGSSTVAGGQDNTATADYAAVGGGTHNESSGDYSTVCGGQNNVASGWSSVVPGGGGNEAAGEFAFAMGLDAHADHNGAVVFADSSTTAVSSQKDDEARFQMEIVAEAGVDDQSARAAKTNVEPVDPEGTLEGVRSLDVSSWEYRDGETGEGDGRRHVGPMAEDFHAAFDVGGSEETISSIDRGGVALAAIQGLSEKLDETRTELRERDDRIDELVAENDVLRERLAGVEERLSALPDFDNSVPADD